MSEKKEMSIAEACAAIDYNPAAASWNSKSDKEKWSAIKAKRIERAVRDAKAVLAGFVEVDLFAKLPADVQAAITTIAVKRVGGGGGGIRKNVFMDNLRGFLVKVGDRVGELEMFGATKMGRGEIRAKVRENLKKADPADRVWVELDADKEEWVLIGLGAEQPKKWAGQAIDE